MTSATVTSGRPLADRISKLPARYEPASGEAAALRVNLSTTGPEPGNWLIAVEGTRCAVFEGSVPLPDAWVFTDSDIAVQVLDGVTTLRQALEERLVDFDGDAAALRQLAMSLGLERES